jgi:hypothetical protein
MQNHGPENSRSVSCENHLPRRSAPPHHPDLRSRGEIHDERRHRQKDFKCRARAVKKFMFSSLRMIFAARHLKLAVKYPVVCLLMCFLLNSCGRSDAELQRRIIGTWIQDGNGGFGLSIAADGSYASKFTGPNSELNYFGIWVVRDGFLVTTITNISALNWTNSVKVGQIDRCRVIGAYKNQLILNVYNNRFKYERRQ